MNGILERLTTVLSDTKLYCINESSLIYAELSAYATALSKLRRQIDRLSPCIFIQERDGECLKRWEELLSISIPYEKDEEMYYEIMTAMFCINDAFNHHQSFHTLMRIYRLFGIDISFDFVASTLFFSYDGCRNIFDCTDACKVFEKVLPAYVRYCLNVEPPDFGELDGFDYTFEQIDGYNIPWGVVKDE